MANDFAITDFVIVDEKLYSVKDAGQALGGLSPHTINTWLSQKKLLRAKVGARTMVRGSELRRIIVDGGKSPGRPRQAKQSTVQALKGDN